MFQLENTVYSSTGTEKYGLTFPPGRREAMGKPCIENNILLIILHINNLAVHSFLKGFIVASRSPLKGPIAILREQPLSVRALFRPPPR